MNALRSTLDEVIADQISKQDEISDSTRSYLHAIINQYSQIASLQDDRTQMEVIRAEALGRSIHVLSPKSKRGCESLLSEIAPQLSGRSRQTVAKGCSADGTIGEMLSAVFIELNEFTHAKTTASELIATLRKFPAKHEFIERLRDPRE